VRIVDLPAPFTTRHPSWGLPARAALGARVACARAEVVRSLWLHDNRGVKEGHVRLLSLHRFQGSLRQHVHPPGGTLSALGDDHRRYPDSHIATGLEGALRTCQALADMERRETKGRLERQRRALISKLDRGYDDYLEGRISEDFWTRKSDQWEEERRALEAQILRLEAPSSQMALTGQQILELAKQAGFLYRTEDPAKQRQWLETVLSNCTFDRGTLCPTYAKPFDLFARANGTGNWRRGWDSHHCRVLKTKDLREFRFRTIRQIRTKA
jgi:hypothetical protein